MWREPNPAVRPWYPSTLRLSAPMERSRTWNAPTGKYASFAYTSALNHLLADRDHVFRIGDATVVCWSRNAKPAYAALFGGVALGSAVPSYTENDLRGMVKKSLCRTVSDLSRRTDWTLIWTSMSWVSPPTLPGFPCGSSCITRSKGFWTISRPTTAGWRSSVLRMTNLRRCLSGGCSARRSIRTPEINPPLPIWLARFCGLS